jgi:GNAT superfamily N-acetyltransferase
VSKYATFRPGARAGPRPEGLTVRPATASDADPIARLSQARDGGVLAMIRDHVAHDIATLGDAGGLLLVAEVGSVVAYGRVARFAHPPRPPKNVAPEGPYLTGVIVDPAWRRRGIAEALTEARLAWIDARAPESYYFANALNEASIALHAHHGFVEVTRDFWYPFLRFEDAEGNPGVGVLFRRPAGGGARITPAAPSSRA